MTASSTKNKLRKILVAALWLAIWQILYLIVDKEILLVSPLGVFNRLCELVITYDFWLSIATSFGRIMTGFAIAIVFATALAVLTTKSRFAYDFFSPAITIIKSTPIASFIILVLIWLPKNTLTSFIVFLMIIPLFWTNISTALNNIDKNLLEMAQVFHLPMLKKILAIYIPAITPYFISSTLTGVGLAWKAGIAAEVLSVPANAIGSKLYYSKIYLQTTDLFAWTFTIIVLSMILEAIIHKALVWLRDKNDRLATGNKLKGVKNND